MQWEDLFSFKRLRRPEVVAQEGRTPFQQDIDRIVFSAAFRRLAHKTQVHPLSQNDHVHTRLTHSVEVASVGRSLGTIVGTEILKNVAISGVNSNAFGELVAAACLAHDIGNPPYGHSGEEAIKAWFNGDQAKKLALSEIELHDFKNFDGNAQGFRILTNVENVRGNGGLQLTYATLGTFAKYPRAGLAHKEPDGYPGSQKTGVFQSELPYFSEVSDSLGLPSRGPTAWSRHPLAFLVEAADDICYSVIDIEDGFALGYIEFEQALALLAPIARDDFSDMEKGDRIAKLRAVAIGNLVVEAAKAFTASLAALLDGTLSRDLISLSPFAHEVSETKRVAKEQIYWSRTKSKLELAGAEVITGLLDTFSEIVIELQAKNFDASQLSARAMKLSRLKATRFAEMTTSYAAMQSFIDTISAMTDRYALDLYRTLRGF